MISCQHLQGESRLPGCQEKMAGNFFFSVTNSEKQGPTRPICSQGPPDKNGVRADSIIAKVGIPNGQPGAGVQALRSSCAKSALAALN